MALKTEIGRDSLEFIEVLFRMQPGSVEKAQFEIDWCMIMAKKFPHLETEYFEHEKEARKRKVILIEVEKQKQQHFEMEPEERMVME